MSTRVALLLLLAVATGTFADSPPNIVLIISDNQSHSLLGTYGNREILTPNIDQLAAEGIRFNHAFSVNGVCSPTRATLMTGLLPSQTGVHVALPTNVDVAGWSAIEEFRNLPLTLKSAGYNTALVGKYHLGEYDEAQLGFDFWVTFPGGHTTTFYDEVVIDNGETYRNPEHLTDFWRLPGRQHRLADGRLVPARDRFGGRSQRSEDPDSRTRRRGHEPPRRHRSGLGRW